MPKIAAVRMGPQDIEPQVGQTWRHRWTGKTATVTGLLLHIDKVLLRHEYRETHCSRMVLLRDYLLES